MHHFNFDQNRKWRLAASLWLLTYLSAIAQTVENVHTTFDQSRQLMLINYDLKGLSYKQEIKITPYLVSSQNELPPAIKTLTGDFNWVSRGGKNKVIIWDPLKDGVNSLSGFQVKINTELRDAAIPRLWGIALQGSNSAPIGIKGIQLSRIGFFAGFRVGKLPPTYRYTVTDAGYMNYLESGVYEIGTEKRLASYAVTAGPVFQVARSTYAYIGAGYGVEQLFWNYQAYNLDKSPVSSDWALNENVNRKGVTVDAGCVLRFGRILIDLGLSTIQFKSFQITGGIGLTFSKTDKL